MNSHNANPATAYHKTPVADDSAVEEAKVISTKLIKDLDLTFNDDDTGGDPYNTTGQHVILKQKNLPKE